MSGFEARVEVTLLTICNDKLEQTRCFERLRDATYVCGTKSRVLVCSGEIDGVVDGTTGNLSKSLLVHGQETGRGTLEFTSTAG